MTFYDIIKENDIRGENNAKLLERGQGDREAAKGYVYHFAPEI